MKPYKLLIKFPTRGRPDKFFSVLDEYIQKATNLNDIGFLITVDKNDETMNNNYVISKLQLYKTKCNIAWIFGDSKTKIQAVNSDINKTAGWDILLLASDDMIPVVIGYDDVIRNNMKEYFADTDGILWYNDGGQNNINTLSIMGRKYFDRFGYIYHPDYISLWCDNEYTEVAQSIDRVYRSDQIIIEHAHPVYKKTQYDELYIKNESYYNIDHETYDKRGSINFGLDMGDPLLSILTPSVPERIDSHLKKLLNKIENQIGNKRVEHLTFIDNKKRSIGYKREALVQIAKGKYMAFVDDDDDVSDDYVDSLLDGIKSGADVITFKQTCLVNDNLPSVVNFSLNNKKNQDYFQNTIIQRMPFHVCAWKSFIGKKYKFTDKNYSEDWFWCQQLIKEAKTEHHIDKILHTYVYRDDTTTTPLPKN